jgi:ketosteroid isomerase-like protein
MKKTVLLLLAFCCTVFSFAQSKNDKAARAVEAIERQRFNAMVSKDTIFLDRVFADDIVYTHANGGMNDKETYLNSIRQGRAVYDKIDIEEMKLRGYNKGKTVIINGMVLFTQPSKEAGKPNLAHIRYIAVYIKNKSKGWQMVSWQSLKLTS